MATPVSKDAALGSIMGAFVGDAAGAVLEFSGIPSILDVEHAMSMPGGGCFEVGPGQITDDSELALCLAKGLLTSSPPALPLEAICNNYVAWLNSPPFDIGYTTRNAIGAGARASGSTIVHSMMAAAQSLSLESKSNGGLMRITPLAVWGHLLPDEALAACAAAETRVTHPNQTCQDCSAAYCLAIAHLIQYPGNNQGAIARAQQWLEANRPGGEALAWLHESAVTDSDPIVDPQGLSRKSIGFVRWGYTLAFYHLRRATPYQAAIADTLLRGGDTDTNAAIVGGLVGALHGASAIPKEMAKPVLDRKTERSEGRPRPMFLQTGNTLELAARLFQLATTADYSEPVKITCVGLGGQPLPSHLQVM